MAREEKKVKISNNTTGTRFFKHTSAPLALKNVHGRKTSTGTSILNGFRNRLSGKFSCWYAPLDAPHLRAWRDNVQCQFISGAPLASLGKGVSLDSRCVHKGVFLLRENLQQRAAQPVNESYSIWRFFVHR